jgi:DNA adenine methylase
VAVAREPNDDRPRPFVKWAGGKRAIVDELRQWMPAEIGTYAEPFCGGGAVFFALAAEPRRRFKRAILTDKNAELVASYRAIKTDVDALVRRLRKYSEEHFALSEEGRRDHFYDVRKLETERLSDVERAARLIFLNKTCFNGLWRVNSSGLFNVPFGRYAKPKILDERRLRAVHVALIDVDIREADFQEATKSLRSGDFAYFDPPYVPVSRTANFTAYAKDGFGVDEQRRLLDELARLRKKNVAAMVSNTCSPETEALYAGYHVNRVNVARAINSDASKRGEVFELVVTTYPTASLPLAGGAS